MGGLWMLPIKLLDGFWMKLSDEDSGLKNWLMEAKEFINYPYGNKFYLRTSFKWNTSTTSPILPTEKRRHGN